MFLPWVGEGDVLIFALGRSVWGINCGVTALMCQPGAAEVTPVGDHVPVTPHHMPKHQPHKGTRGALAQMSLKKKNKDLG